MTTSLLDKQRCFWIPRQTRRMSSRQENFVLSPCIMEMTTKAWMTWGFAHFIPKPHEVLQQLSHTVCLQHQLQLNITASECINRFKCGSAMVTKYLQINGAGKWVKGNWPQFWPTIHQHHKSYWKWCGVIVKQGATVWDVSAEKMDWIVPWPAVNVVGCVQTFHCRLTQTRRKTQQSVNLSFRWPWPPDVSQQIQLQLWLFNPGVYRCTWCVILCYIMYYLKLHKFYKRETSICEMLLPVRTVASRPRSPVTANFTNVESFWPISSISIGLDYVFNFQCKYLMLLSYIKLLFIRLKHIFVIFHFRHIQIFEFYGWG